MNIAGDLVGDAMKSLLDEAGKAIADSAVWLLGQLGSLISASTEVPLGTTWFSQHYAVVAAVSASVAVPMVCCSIIQAVIQQDPALAARSVLVNLPLALILTGAAVEIVEIALRVTDNLSSDLLSGTGANTADVLQPFARAMIVTAASPGVPGFIFVLSSVLVVIAGFSLWVELAIRAAAVSAAVLFLPLALAGLSWPAVSHWPRRLAETLTALILSKMVIAGVLSLAAAAVAGAGEAGGGGFPAVVTGIALLVVATMCPFVMLRLVPATESGAMAQLEGVRQRMRAATRAPRQMANAAIDVFQAFDGSGGGDSTSIKPGTAGGGGSGGSGGGAGRAGGGGPSDGPSGGGAMPNSFSNPEDAVNFDPTATPDATSKPGSDETFIAAVRSANDAGMQLDQLQGLVDPAAGREAPSEPGPVSPLADDSERRELIDAV